MRAHQTEPGAPSQRVAQGFWPFLAGRGGVRVDLMLLRHEAPLLTIKSTNSDRYRRLAIFIDGKDLEETAHALGGAIDFRKLRSAFSEHGQLLRATYYALTQDGSYFSGRPLLDWLVYNGYTVREKVAPDTLGQRGSRSACGALAMELAIDALDLAPHVGTLVLFAGGGQFVPLLDALKRRGPRVLIVSTIRTKQAFISQDLRRKADEFVELADLLPRIAMTPKARDCTPVP
jgi:uncharacterized LabA/DUF88 family protein